MIAHTIRLTLAAVFVPVAIGNILNFLSKRLGRTVDRACRVQELQSHSGQVEDAPA